jgi:hypothetical protein
MVLTNHSGFQQLLAQTHQPKGATVPHYRVNLVFYHRSLRLCEVV